MANPAKSATEEELDQLLRETQDIWKSLTNSGISMANNDHTNSNFSTTIANLFDNKIDFSPTPKKTNPSSESKKKETPPIHDIKTGNNSPNSSNIFKAHLTPSSNFNISNISTPISSNNKNEPKNDSFFSKINSSDINNKPENDNPPKSNNLDNLTGLTSFSVNQGSKENDLSEFNFTNSNIIVDPDSQTWTKINELLQKFQVENLDKKIKNENELYEALKDIFNKYEKQQNFIDYLNSDNANLKIENENVSNELYKYQSKNKDLQKQLEILNTKIIDIENENKYKNNENMNQDILNLKRKLQHYDELIKEKDNEIFELKKKYEKIINIDKEKRENVESLFNSIKKRKIKKNGKDDETVSIIGMYEEEREKMSNEINVLKKQIYSINKKLFKNNDKKMDNKNDADYISFCLPDSNSDNDGDDDNDHVMKSTHLHHYSGKELNKDLEVNNIYESHKIEMDRLNKEVSKLMTKLQDEETKNLLMEEKTKQLELDLEKRPSSEEWKRLKLELNKMSKELKETKAVADLRRYMNTRELIQRDKDIHNLKLNNITNLPVKVIQEIFIDICRFMSVNDITKLPNIIKKLVHMNQFINILETLVTKIVTVIISSSHGTELIKIKRKNPKEMFNHIIPLLKQWIANLDEYLVLKDFYKQINQLLVERSIFKNNNQTTNKITVIPFHDIVTQISELIESEEFLLKSKNVFNNAEKEILSDPENMSNKMIKHFQTIFEVDNLDGVFAKMNSVYMELNETKNFINTLKSMFGLNRNCTFNLLHKMIEDLVDKENGNTCSNNVLLELKDLMKCKENEIVEKFKSILDRCNEYDAVFPRVHHLLNQLQNTLGVEHAHQILPKIQSLISVSI